MKHLARDLESAKKSLLTMGALVEAQLDRAISAVIERSELMAHEVMRGDREIDEREVEVEEECLKLLALHQPVADHLRFVIAVLKVNNDLERMGDLAINIAERAAYLARRPPLGVPLDFWEMTEATRRMVHDSLDALIRQDTTLARAVIAGDDVVDAANRRMFDVLQDAMKADPTAVKRAVQALSISRHLERIADLATNIAEDVVFMVDGEVIRHHFERFEDEPQEEESEAGDSKRQG